MCKTQVERNRKYKDKKVDEIKLQIPKGYKERIKEAAAERGTSMNQFIFGLIKDALDRANDDVIDVVEFDIAPRTTESSPIVKDLDERIAALKSKPPQLRNDGLIIALEEERRIRLANTNSFAAV